MAVRPEVAEEEILEISSGQVSGVVVVGEHLEVVCRVWGSVDTNEDLTTEVSFRAMIPHFEEKVMEEEQEVDVETLVLETKVYEILG